MEKMQLAGVGTENLSTENLAHCGRTSVLVQVRDPVDPSRALKFPAKINIAASII